MVRFKIWIRYTECINLVKIYAYRPMYTDANLISKYIHEQ